MKTFLGSSLRLVLWLAGCTSFTLPVRAITFTTDTTISFDNTNYDGVDIVVTNCTLTVDGMHSFASLQVLDGGIVTHSFATNGLLENLAAVIGEQHALYETNAAALNFSNAVLTSLVVKALSGSVTYANGVDYVTSSGDNHLTTIARTQGSAITNGETVRVDYQFDTPVPAGLALALAGDVIILPGGAINATGKGYGGSFGPGPGQSAGGPANGGGGGGHGGYGGLSFSNVPGGIAYGATHQPVDKGSGGGAGSTGIGASGGGAIRLLVGGTLRVDGAITASGLNATNSRAGGGAGGSIWLTASNLAGAGTINADGGAGEPSRGGGGGGGRIAIYSETNQYSGSLFARGGLGAMPGGAGTTYTKGTNQPVGVTLVDNGGRSGANTLLAAAEPFDLTVRGAAKMTVVSAQAVRNLVIASNAWFVVTSQALTITGSATVDSGGGILANGTGFPSSQGIGSGGTSSSGTFGVTGGGGGHGGFGAASVAGGNGGNSYGSLLQPAAMGSGGGRGNGTSPGGQGGAGGGAVRLSVFETLVLNGVISANGTDGVAPHSGGGSGGSVWITAGTLIGSGVISANGGAGNGLGGGGGGGRIAVYYTSNLFSGTITALGNDGGTFRGGAGTIFTKANNQSAGSVIVDNGGVSGTNTTFGSFSTFTSDLALNGRAALVWPSGSSYTIRNLFLDTGTFLIATNSSQVTITVTSNATIRAGTALTFDGGGFPGSQGTGAGGTTNSMGAGGGYGGQGGASVNGARGGSAYGVNLAGPVDRGSGGGSAGREFGGAGGGSLRLNVSGTLLLDGDISADGQEARGLNAGGGSGGSLWLSAGRLAGSGSITANGGAGNNYGGGGGGGRIAVTYGTNLFSGVISAFGGPGGGGVWGGAGTIYRRANSSQLGSVLVDNGGHGGTTPLTTEWSGDLAIAGRATAVNTLAARNLNNLLIASNSLLLTTNATAITLYISSNAVIEAGGILSVEGAGYSSGSGIGPGRVIPSIQFGTTGSGAGYGGVGGNSAGGAQGGVAYGGSMSQPTYLGSGGGAATTGSGGAGGGALLLIVKRVLLLDGTISANGRDATNLNSGGGSGGSVWLIVETLAGSGKLTANGGAGGNYGGGGGGGRIAIEYETNSFNGSLAAYGGGGNAWGGAGTVYLKASNQPVAQVLVDNGGRAGAHTPFTALGVFDFTVQGGGVLSPSGFQVGPSFRNLLVRSNGWVMLTNLIVTATNVIVETGGGIVADGAGYRFGGPGGGRTSQTQTGSGGGHGGYGASSGTAAGGNGYDTAVSPVTMGSAGGNGSGGSPGGAGGGVIRMQVTGKLQVDGSVSADGMAGQGANAGGGSGGSVLLDVFNLSGSGLISANGGAGNGTGGGGGGGGRIAVRLIGGPWVINYGSNSFAGTYQAWGGASGSTNPMRFGGAGTIYLTPNDRTAAQVLADNGGRLGTNTLLLDSSFFDLTIQGGAAVVPVGSLSIYDLFIASNGWLVPHGLPVTLSGKGTIQAGGGILADRAGYAGGQGPGAGTNHFSSAYGYTGGGGGHGGLGAPSDGDAAGGKAYGVAQFSFTGSGVFSGSGGGGNPTNSAGAGGGIIRLSAPELVVDGRISAGGGDGVYQHGGGGSGGSIALNVGLLSGSGVISADGGDGNGVGGGGGGGRIAITCSTNQFAGAMQAWGGLGGGGAGGAGTIYLKTNSLPVARLLVDNGGWPGVETPLENQSSVGLNVSGGATVQPSAPYLAVNDLLVDAFGVVVSASEASNLDLIVYGNAIIAAGAAISGEGRGFSQANGPGAGLSADGFGSGAGHGGLGGASVTAPGGITYGSFAQPADRGSGGGFGSGPIYDGSQGGGAIRLNVGGTLTVNGRLSANGSDGLQDSAGGGSGGSIWVTTRAFAGDGEVTAHGGAGEWFGGGGGAGGRIAIYYRTSSPTNRFTGLVSAYGGEGTFWGEDGSVFLSSGFATLQVVSQTPSGVVSNSVDHVDLRFNAPVNPGSFSGSDFTLSTPTRTLFGTNLSWQTLSPSDFRVLLSSPLTEVGAYVIRVGPAIEDLYGWPMSQVYAGAFAVVLPMIQGKITDANGLPVPGVLLQPSAGVSPTLTDGSGHYALGFVPGSSFSVRPAKTGLMFAPGSLSYANVTATLTNQDFLAVETIAPPIQTGVQGTNFVLGWYGYSGVSYQLLYSTNLVNWLPYGGVMVGSNAFIQVPAPVEGEPMQFFRVQANN